MTVPGEVTPSSSPASTPLDSDKDTLPDVLDDDNDNDGWPDDVELDRGSDALTLNRHHSTCTWA